jgi:SAM-dependent methyltransferase
MRRKVKTLVQEIMPPLLWRSIRSLAGRLRGGAGPVSSGGVQAAAWYDAVYEASDEYRVHYTASRYYFLWTVVADRILHAAVPRILDLGCGPGQFASLLRDKGVRHYRGVDFSSRCVELARERCPEFDFQVVDLSVATVPPGAAYDCVVALEFLEHVAAEIDVIRGLTSGARFLATVPNFPYVSHVRHFDSSEQVQERYGDLFAEFRVDSFDENDQGKRYYLLDGFIR